MSNYPQFPFYIPTKSRSEYMITSKILTELGIKHYLIVEKEQILEYQKSINQMNLMAEILELNLNYKKNYELCDDLGLSKSTGPGPARNFAWDHSKQNGFKWHWVMDDNITSFRILNNNEKVKTTNPVIFKLMEDFSLRYTNVAMSGPNYYMFAPARQKIPPFVINTRIYSCNLIRNDVPHIWRGRYNEDTIISLDMLKAGWCTIQFNAFLQQKMPTQTIGGGNTKEFYHAEGVLKEGQKYADNGTLAKSKMLVKVHPDISKLVWKFGRWHHVVDYKSFKKNILVKKLDIKIKNEINNYGLKLKIKKD